MIRWLEQHWVAGAGFMAAGFLCLVPFLMTFLPVGFLLLYLHTPGYMIHQVEEHQGDRFRRFVNERMFKGLEALRTVDVLVVNLPLVWGLNLGSLYAAVIWGTGYGLAAPYAMLINAITHVAAAVRLKRYNPGVVSSVLVFTPLSITTIWTAAHLPDVTISQHLAALGLAAAIHALILAQAVRQYRRQQAAHSDRGCVSEA
ncbi:HXXEE domain-containing protein [Geminicoccus roseus]|uniref:HXXEE domain-containing protein n=1 Tax=Geminicoccus roseus TaxID=404900 RepID=UPI0005566751|nr:HXXEE domain-containing protein [Geminicoccus roseus]